MEEKSPFSAIKRVNYVRIHLTKKWNDFYEDFKHTTEKRESK